MSPALNRSYGALPETTAGFARLIPTKLSQEEYEKRFVREAVLPDCGRARETFVQFAWRLSDHES